MKNDPFLTPIEWERKVGSSLRELRLLERLTQADLADLANLSISSIKRLEDGRGSSLSTLIRVVRSLNKTEWLGELAESTPRVGPMELLRQSQVTAEGKSRRVRHRRTHGER